MTFADLRLSQLLEGKLWGQTHCKVLKCPRSREKEIVKKRERVLQSSYHSGHQPLQLQGFSCNRSNNGSSEANCWAQEICHLVPEGNKLEGCKNLGPKSTQPSSPALQEAECRNVYASPNSLLSGNSVHISARSFQRVSNMVGSEYILCLTVSY